MRVGPPERWAAAWSRCAAGTGLTRPAFLSSSQVSACHPSAAQMLTLTLTLTRAPMVQKASWRAGPLYASGRTGCCEPGQCLHAWAAAAPGVARAAPSTKLRGLDRGLGEILGDSRRLDEIRGPDGERPLGALLYYPLTLL